MCAGAFIVKINNLRPQQSAMTLKLFHSTENLGNGECPHALLKLINYRLVS